MNTKRNDRTKRITRVFSLAMSLLLATTVAASAATESSVAERTRSAAAPQITFGDCRMESMPPYEEGTFFECGSGEVVVAVYSKAVRCCALKLG